MLIDFPSIPENVIPNMKGGEKEFRVRAYDDGKTRLMRGRLVPGASIGMHTHETNCEVVFVLSGTGKYLYDGTEERLEPGVCHYCPKGHSHSLINDGTEDLVFFAVVPEQ